MTHRSGTDGPRPMACTYAHRSPGAGALGPPPRRHDDDRGDLLPAAAHAYEHQAGDEKGDYEGADDRAQHVARPPNRLARDDHRAMALSSSFCPAIGVATEKLAMTIIPPGLPGSLI